MGLRLGSQVIPTISLYKSNGVVPQGVFEVPSNSGVYDIKSYAFARAEFEDNLYKRIDGDYNFSYYSNSTISIIASYAFAGTSIVSVDLPNVVRVSDCAFYKCMSLVSINMPLASAVTGDSAFKGCESLLSASFPMISTLGNSVFEECFSLLSINLPSCASIGYCCFRRCSSLSQISIPACTNLGGQYVFEGCITLKSAILPQCSRIPYGCFGSCYQLSLVSAPVCSLISGYAFNSCFKLASLYLMSTSVVVLSSSNAFNSCAIRYSGSSYLGNVYGSVYVPTSLAETYKTATN